MNQGIQIGEVAKRAGVSVDTVRYYERRKLLPAAPRTTAGYRMFNSDTVDRVIFIKQAQDLGFSLDEIGILVPNNGKGECRTVRDLLKAKLNELDDRMEKMASFKLTLERNLSECEAELRRRPASPDCPVVADITRSGRK
jgi:MerR family mercuric resistance operon transcriptional regulator